MVKKILMPALSPTMKSGTLVKWVIKKGDIVKPGDYIADIETDKATMEMECMDQGIVSDLLPEGTDNVKVGDIIAVFVEEGDDHIAIGDLSHASAKDSQQERKKNEAENIHADLTHEQPHQHQSDSLSEKVTDIRPSRVLITPAARKEAYQRKIDINTVSGSGPNSRIRMRDIEAYVFDSEKETQSVIDMSNMQAIIAQKMVDSKVSVPHFYVEQQVEVDELLKVKDSINKLQKVSINDIFIKAIAVALSQTSSVNINYVEGGKIQNRSSIDIGVAVGIDGGIVTPVIHSADKASIWDLSKSIKSHIKSIKEGDFSSSSNDGVMTVSNLGMFGVDKFVSIINPPMPFGLSIGRVMQVPLVKDSEISIANVVKLVLSADHRVINGIDAARLMSNLKQVIEDPILIFT